MFENKTPLIRLYTCNPVISFFRTDRENQTKIKSQFGSPQSVVAKKGM